MSNPCDQYFVLFPLHDDAKQNRNCIKQDNSNSLSKVQLMLQQFEMHAAGTLVSEHRSQLRPNPPFSRYNGTCALLLVKKS